MEVTTVIFDLDGTLLDTLDDLCSGFNFALEKFGYKKRTKEEFKSFVGNGVRKALERAAGENISDNELDKITRCFKEYYINHNNELTKPYPGIVSLLKKLKENGYKTAILSNKFDDAVKSLSGIYFDGYIDYALGEGYGIKRKPDISGINKICEALSEKIENCVYVGDSDTDIQTAVNAGILPISVNWGFRTEEFLKNSGAVIIAYSPDEIFSIVNSR